MIPEGTREAVLAALGQFDAELRQSEEWSDWVRLESHKYAIAYEGRRYPVKKIVSMATHVPVSSFSGGEEANGWAERLGFRVVELRRVEANEFSLQHLFEYVLSQYETVRAEGDFGSSHPLWQHFVLLEGQLANLPSLKRRPGMHVKWSVGKGNWASVPWLAVIDSREADAPTGGVYCVYLFREDMTGVYVTLNQGVTRPKKDLGAGEARAYLRDRATHIRTIVADLQESGFQLNNDIDLRSAGLGQDYQDSTIAHKLYEADAVPPDADIAADLETLLRAYEKSLEPTYGESAWIFQANPKLYNIDDAVINLTQMSWLVSTYRDRILPGDKVFLWQSGAEGGIVAEATVVTAPAMADIRPAELKFALTPDKFSGPQWRVNLRIDCPVIPPLPRERLKADPRLADLSILKFSQGTNFAVTLEQAIAIRELLEEHQRGEDETTTAARSVTPKPLSRVWAYAPGPKAQLWEEFYRDEIMAIGWGEMGDLRQYPDRDSIAHKLVELYHPQGEPINDSKACYDFAYTIKPGDRVIAKRGRDEVVGYGIVTGDYKHRSDKSTYPNTRHVRWERRGNWPCKPIFSVKTLTDFTPYPETVDYLMKLIGVAELSTAPLVEAVPRYTIDDALSGVAFEKTEFQAMLETWQRKKNLILQGPPGVGKTFLARRMAYALLGREDPSRVETVQFHQSYSYEDFVQGYRPSEVGFTRKDGIFVRFCKRASLDQDLPYVFIIDEINRSNLSKVFGELLMLIEADKRGSKYSLALTYSTSEEEQFYVPPNVYILG